MADFIKLNWVIESTNQTEQRIYRKIDDNPEELLATVPVSSVEYSDTTAPGLMTTQASYRVESVGVYRGVETIKTSLTETYTVPIQSNGLAGMTSADKNLSVVALEPISLWVNGIAVETESNGSPYRYTSPSTGEARYVQLSSVDNTSPIPTVQFLSGFDTLEEWGTLGLGVVSLGPDILTVPDHIPESLTNLSMMFANSTKFNDPNVALWDVSNVTNMSYLFANTSAFNQPIGSWNVSAVSNMDSMFSGAQTFNQPLDNWDVSSVVRARDMFATSVAFNQDLSNWDVSNLVIMSNMFSYSEAFNGNISNWNTGNVTAMYGLFRGAKAFNQPLNQWDTSKVLDMSWMFANNTAFDQPLDSWNTGAVTSMQGMFNNNNKFDKPIGSWNVSNVNYMNRMFQGSTYLNRHDLSQWCVGRIGGTPPDFCPNNYSYQNWPVWGTCPRGENVQQ